MSPLSNIQRAAQKLRSFNSLLFNLLVCITHKMIFLRNNKHKSAHKHINRITLIYHQLSPLPHLCFDSLAGDRKGICPVNILLEQYPKVLAFEGLWEPGQTWTVESLSLRFNGHFPGETASAGAY